MIQTHIYTETLYFVTIFFLLWLLCFQIVSGLLFLWLLL